MKLPEVKTMFNSWARVSSHVACDLFVHLNMSPSFLGLDDLVWMKTAALDHMYEFFVCHPIFVWTPFNFHSMYFGLRVGEAKNPGPCDESICLAICNPTAINKKVGQLLRFGADIITASETSATNIVQKDVSRDMSAKGYKSYWSLPVAPKKSTVDCRPSYRGELLDLPFSLLCHPDNLGVMFRLP